MALFWKDATKGEAKHWALLANGLDAENSASLFLLPYTITYGPFSTYVLRILARQ